MDYFLTEALEIQTQALFMHQGAFLTDSSPLPLTALIQYYYLLVSLAKCTGNRAINFRGEFSNSKGSMSKLKRKPRVKGQNRMKL